jgi:hypothetical protein
MLCDRRKSKKAFKRIFSFSLFFLPDQSMNAQQKKEWSFMNAAWHPLSPENPSHPLTRKSSCLNLQGKKKKQTNKLTLQMRR